MNNIFLTVLHMSLTGSFVIAAVCLARLLLKKAPKYISYMLWIVVAFRLLVPFSVESTFSLIPFNASQAIPQTAVTQTLPEMPVDMGLSGAGNQTSGGNNITQGVPNTSASNQRPLQEAAPLAPASQVIWWPGVFAALWLVGFVAMVAYGTVSYYMLYLKMAKAGRIDANVYRAANITSPFVLGLIKPKIFLPPYLKAHEREYILLHEQTHIGRKDHIVKLVAYLILSLHWFNPLAWIGFLQMEKDMEMSCDERVIRELGGGIKKDYSMTLLSLATDRRRLIASPLAFGESGTKARVKNVLNFRRPSRIFAVVAVVLVLGLSIGLGMNRATANAPAEIAADDEYNNDRTPDEGINDALEEQDRLANIDHSNTHHEALVERFATDHIQQTISTWFSEDQADLITETHIDVLEKVAMFDHILAHPIELWRFTFNIRVEYDEEVRWGTIHPDENGWIVGLNHTTTLLVFSLEDTGLNFMGSIPWYLEVGLSDVEAPWWLELSLRSYLEHEGYLLPVFFPGNHYLVYIALGSQDFQRNRLLLSQPFGEDGIWVVERLQQLDNRRLHHILPQSDTLSMMEYFAQQQTLFRVGNAPWLGDPLEVAMAYLEQRGWASSVFTGIYPVPAGTANPLYLPGDDTDTTSADSGESPVDAVFTPVWLVAPTLEHEYIRLCSCGVFFGPDWMVIDPVTGLSTGDMKLGHGGPGPGFVYDPALGLFGQPSYGFFYHDLIGMHPMDEFEAIAPSWTLSNSGGLISVQSVDSSMRNYMRYEEYTLPEWDDYWNLDEEAFSGRFAVMYNRRLITNFIFDDGAHWWYRFSFNEDGSGRENLDFIAMRHGGSWGLIDINGNGILPFMFENLIVINEHSAFARVDGRYGILDISGR